MAGRERQTRSGSFKEKQGRGPDLLELRKGLLKTIGDALEEQTPERVDLSREGAEVLRLDCELEVSYRHPWRVIPRIPLLLVGVGNVPDEMLEDVRGEYSGWPGGRDTFTVNLGNNSIIGTIDDIDRKRGLCRVKMITEGDDRVRFSLPNVYGDFEGLDSIHCLGFLIKSRFDIGEVYDIYPFSVEIDERMERLFANNGNLKDVEQLRIELAKRDSEADLLKRTFGDNFGEGVDCSEWMELAERDGREFFWRLWEETTNFYRKMER